MAPLRVAQVMGKMVGGGVEAVVMNYYRHIDRKRFQFDFVVDADSTLVPSEEIASLGGRVFEVPPYQRQPSNTEALVNLFNTYGWTAVHSHMNSLSVIPLRAARMAKVPVRIAHSHSTWGKGEWKRNAVKALLRTQANRYPTHRIACSELAGDWLFGRNAKYSIIRNAIDGDKYLFSQEKRQNIRSELGISEGSFVVGHLGRFTMQKNHSKLIEIFKAVHEICADSVLVLCGTGPLEGEIKSQVEETSLNDYVLFLGQRDDSQELYSAFDCFCLPSLYEGLPVVSVESQFAGLPLVMSDEVSKEAVITRRSLQLPLAATGKQWAEVLLSTRGASRELSKEDSLALSPYDIEMAAPHLVSFYEKAFGAVVK